jgi:hypothetical protein
METNFFQQLASLNVTSNIRLNIQSLPDKSMVVSILAVQGELSDKAVNKIPSLLLKGTACKLDAGFFDKISAPIKKTDELITNLLTYQNSVEKAKGESRIQKDKESADKKARDARKPKYDEQMKKVAELEAKKLYGQAIAQTPDAKLYPEYSEEIKTKLNSLRGNHGTLSLFGEETAAQPETPTDILETFEIDPFHADDPEDDNDEPEVEEEPEEDEF